MKKLNIGIFLSLLLMVGLCSCGEQKSNTKLVLNEVLIENESNFQDDYGVHSAWIEIFNRSFGSADLAGCLLKVSSQPGDTATYFIPKGDVLTLVKPRQHALFWADGEPNRGTFHTNFTLNAATDNWIGLYDSGKKLLDQIIVPAGTLQANQSYARVSDAANEWEVKGSSADKYVTPSTNNKTINSHAKMEKFEEHDGSGIGMAISAMSVVFCGLLLLFILFKCVGKISVNLSKRNAMKVKGITDKQEAKEKKLFGKKKKDKKDEKIEELTDRVKRQMAEFENFRKRTEKEKAGMYAVGAKDVIEKILPVVDNFERGLDVAEDKEDPFVQGMEKIYKQFLTALDGMGVKAIEAVGNEFNPDFHNAVMHVEDETVGENIIVEEFQKGYMYKDSVIRHSMVKVAN